MILIIIFIIPSLSPSSLSLREIIYVDDDNVQGPWDGSLEHPFRLIQEAVNASDPGMKIFVFQGIISGTVGTILGCLIGYLLCWSQLKYQWFSLPSDIYFINALPIEMKILDFVLIAFAGILICFIATLYPSHRAAKLDPVQAIRYE